MHRPTGSTRTARRLAAGLVAVSLGLLSACGGDDDSGDDTAAATSSSSEAQTSASESPAAGATSSGAEQPAGGTLAVTSIDFGYELDSEELAAGDYTIELTNDGSATHDLVVEQDGAELARTETIGPGQTSSLEVTLEPGEYVFYCSVGNHRSMGMEVTVTVT